MILGFGLILSSCSATRKHINKNNTTTVSVYAAFFGASPQTLRRDQPAVLTWTWHAATDSLRQDYIDAATFKLNLDGQNIDVSEADMKMTDDKEGFYVTWYMPAIVLQRGSHEVMMTVVFDKQINDGFYSDKDGSLNTFGPDPTKFPPTTIIVK